MIQLASKTFNFFRLLGKPDHRKNIHQSRAIISKLRTFESDGQLFAYIKKIDPLVFEEMILTLAEEAGAFVLRNRRYTGDGGSDGTFYAPGVGWFAIQCKRYHDHINPQHVAHFSELVARKKMRGGLFVHTGKTGAGSYNNLKLDRNIILISGSKLANAIKRRKPFNKFLTEG